MKKILAFVILSALAAFGQNPVRVTISANSVCQPFFTKNFSTVGINVAGTFNGTLTASVQISGINGTTSQVIPVTGVAIGAVPQATIVGTGGAVNAGFTAEVSGFTQFNLCSTAWSSGSAVIDLYGTPAVDNPLYSIFPNVAGTSDPCANPNIIPQPKVLNLSASTKVIANVSGQQIYVCGDSYVLGGTTPTIGWEYGTGTTCGTGTTIIVAPMAITVGTPFVEGFGGRTVIGPVPASQDLCAVVTGTSPTVSGHLNFLQQ